MAKQFSDNFAAAQPGLVFDTQRKLPSAKVNARLRYKRMDITLDLAPDDFGIGDIAVMGQFKSSDCIEELLISNDTLSTLLAVDIGLHRSGQNHDGTVVDQDRFCSAIAIGGSALSRSDQFQEAGLTVFDRGRHLWEIVGMAADPVENWDLTMTATAAIATADERIMIEVYYTSGD